MKKIILAITLLFVFTACSRPADKLLTTTCSTNEGGMELKMVLHHDGEKIKSYDSSTTIDFNGITTEEELVKMMTEVETQYKDIDGYTFSYSIEDLVIKQTLSVDLSKIDTDAFLENINATGLEMDDINNYKSFIETTKKSGLDCK